MRWQSFGHEEPEGMSEDLSHYDLETLHKIEKKIEEHLSDLRSKEPPAKRKYESEHKIWFSQCQECVDELNKLREVIDTEYKRWLKEEVGIPYEQLMEIVRENQEMRAAYERGEIKDDWSEECRQNWIERCNSQFTREALSHELGRSLGKKIDIVYSNGETYSGYIFEHSYAEDSDIGEESITLAPLGKDYELELPVEGIVSFRVDPNYKTFD